MTSVKHLVSRSRLTYLRIYHFIAVCLVVISATLITIQINERILIGHGFDGITAFMSVSFGIGIYCILRLQWAFNERLSLAVSVTSTCIVLLTVNASIIIVILFVILTLLFAWSAGLIIPYFSSTDGTSVLRWWMRFREYQSLTKLWIKYRMLSRYSQTFLGILWIVIQPLAISLILAVAFSQLLDRQAGDDIPFVAFFLSGLTFWNFFHSAVHSGSTLLLNSMSLMVRVYFPREIIIFVHIGQQLIELFFTIISMIIINMLVGIFPNIYWLYLPILLMIQCLLILGFVLFLCVLSVYFRDIPQLVGVVLRLLFYLTPLLYPLSIWPDALEPLFQFNPMAMLIVAYRDILIYQQPPDIVSLHMSFVVSIWIVIGGYIFLKINESRISDYR